MRNEKSEEIVASKTRHQTGKLTISVIALSDFDNTYSSEFHACEINHAVETKICYVYYSNARAAKVICDE